MQYIEKGQDPAYDNKTPSWQGHMYINQAGKDRSQLWRQTVSNWGRSVCLPSRRADKHEAIETRTDTARHTGREIQSKTTYKLKKQRNKGTKKNWSDLRLAPPLQYPHSLFVVKSGVIAHHFWPRLFVAQPLYRRRRYVNGTQQ